MQLSSLVLAQTAQCWAAWVVTFGQDLAGNCFKSLIYCWILNTCRVRMKGCEGETFCVKLLEFHHVTLCHLGESLPHVRQKGKDLDRLKSLTCPVG